MLSTIVVSIVLAQCVRSCSCSVCAVCMSSLHMVLLVGIFVCQQTTWCMFQLIILFYYMIVTKLSSIECMVLLGVFSSGRCLTA